MVLYELLTGRRPFGAKSTTELRYQILRDDPTPPGVFEPAVPEELERVCLRCLVKRPEGRYQRADEVRRDLMTYLDSIERDQGLRFERKSL